MASRLVVSVSTATTPNSCARAIHSFRRASVRTHSYFERSILALRAALARAAASEIGVNAPCSGLSLPPPLWGRVGEGGANRSLLPPPPPHPPPTRRAAPSTPGRGEM